MIENYEPSSLNDYIIIILGGNPMKKLFVPTALLITLCIMLTGYTEGEAPMAP